MQYFTIPGLDRPVSRFIYGTAIPSMMAGEDASAWLDEVYASGINTFDTAHIYGKSECSLGSWIRSRGLEDKVNVLTKGCHHNEYRSRVTVYDLKSDFMDSLAKLQLERVDLYLLHRDDPSVPVGPIVEALNELHAEGLISCFGGSNWTYQRIEEANEYACKHGLQPFAISSPCFSLAEQVGDPWGGSVHISGPSGREARSWYIKEEMPILAYSSLARGFLSGKFSPDSGKRLEEIFPQMGPSIAKEYTAPENYERLRRAERLATEKNATVPQIALAWALHHPMFTAPILSPTKSAHLRDNLAAFDLQLTREEFLYLNLGEE